MRDPFGPLHQGEELLVGCLADIGDGVVGLGECKNKTVSECARELLLGTAKCVQQRLAGAAAISGSSIPSVRPDTKD